MGLIKIPTRITELFFAGRQRSDDGAAVLDVYNHSLPLDGDDSVVTIDKEHHEIHEGHHYFVASFETVANGGSVNFAVTTPTNVVPHMTFKVYGTSRTELYIYEDADIDADGTVVTPNNNNRNSGNVSAITLRKNPTINADGTLLYSQSWGKEGATPAAADTGGVADRERELPLKLNSTTIFRVTSRENGNIISYVGEWYEELT